MKVYTQRYNHPHLEQIEKAVIEIENVRELGHIISGVKEYKKFWEKYPDDMAAVEHVKELDKMLEALDVDNEKEMSKFNVNKVKRLDKANEMSQFSLNNDKKGDYALMDIADCSWDEIMEVSECYIKELEGRLQYTHSRAKREHIEFMILKEKTLVNAMNTIGRYKPYDIYNISYNPYLEALCRLEMKEMINDKPANVVNDYFKQREPNENKTQSVKISKDKDTGKELELSLKK